MIVLNLIDSKNSDIKYYITCFPDGELQIKLEEFSRKDEILIKCRICNSNDLFILCQVMDILDRNEVIYDVDIYYLMSMRMDRVMDFNRPFTLKVVSKIINGYNHRYVTFLDLHSERIIEFNSKFYNSSVHFDILLQNILINDNYQIVIPDEGAKNRINWTHFGKHNPIFCSKERDPETGKLNNFTIQNPEDFAGDRLIICDDLCDGGGTFLGLAKVIKEEYPNVPIDIYVTHMVNKQGLLNLANTFNHVWFTNSYCDWKSGFEANGEKWPNNVTQINIIDEKL